MNCFWTALSATGGEYGRPFAADAVIEVHMTDFAKVNSNEIILSENC